MKVRVKKKYWQRESKKEERYGNCDWDRKKRLKKQRLREREREKKRERKRVWEREWNWEWERDSIDEEYLGKKGEKKSRERYWMLEWVRKILTKRKM
jgi:hypothetical protein